MDKWEVKPAMYGDNQVTDQTGTVRYWLLYHNDHQFGSGWFNSKEMSRLAQVFTIKGIGQIKRPRQ